MPLPLKATILGLNRLIFSFNTSPPSLISFLKVKYKFISPCSSLSSCDCAKSFQGEAPGGSAVQAAWATCPCPPPPPPCPPSLMSPHLWYLYKAEHQLQATYPQLPRGYVVLFLFCLERKHMLLGTSHCSCLEHCFLFALLDGWRRNVVAAAPAQVVAAPSGSVDDVAESDTEVDGALVVKRRERLREKTRREHAFPCSKPPNTRGHFSSPTDHQTEPSRVKLHVFTHN